MFKNTSAENELFQSMAQNLKSTQVEKKHGLNKIAKAADLLNTAATIFDQAGMTAEADRVTAVLHSLAMENFSLSDLAGLKEEDLHNLLEMSTPHQLIQIAKKVASVAKGDSSIGEELMSALKEFDVTDPTVRENIVSKIMTGLKVAKFFV